MPLETEIIWGIEMTKSELVAKLAEEGNVAKKAALTILDGLVKTLHESLKAGEKIRINGLGTFVVVDRKARTGVNPQTRAKIKISATKVPAFRASKALKDAVKPPAKKKAKKDTKKEQVTERFAPQQLGMDRAFVDLGTSRCGQVHISRITDRF